LRSAEILSVNRVAPRRFFGINSGANGIITAIAAEKAYRI